MNDQEVMSKALEGIDWLRHHLIEHHGCLHMSPSSSGIPAWLDEIEDSLRERIAHHDRQTKNSEGA